MTTEERLALIEERHANLAMHVDTLMRMHVENERRMEKTDIRINRLFDITVRIGADFSERIRNLEKRNEE